MEMRFGITMRITNADGYNEPRDTIAHDWAAYMSEAFPEAKFLFVPNIGENTVEYIKKWGVNILIISGGDDIGVTPLRDSTESILLKYAIESNMPVIAICRGLQLVHTYFGGRLINGDKNFIDRHRAVPHTIQIGDTLKEVNSYHTNLIEETSVSKEANILARCAEDNSIEAFSIKNILATMWHPERDKTVSKWNKTLIENFIKDTHITSNA